MSLKRQRKIVRVIWIIVAIMISITMVLFTAGAHLVGGGGFY